MAAEVSKRRALGRGLDALLPAVPAGGTASALASSAGTIPAKRGPELFLAPIEDVHPSRKQPRERFEDATLDELARSIEEIGVLEPILVRKRHAGGYEIVAGERRWRAAQRARLHEVPVLVRELSDERAFEAALIENLQRENLNPLETARAFQRLVDEHGHNVESIAKLVGKDRSTVANALRLLKLPESVLARIATGELSEGHGRALLGAGGGPAVERLAREVVEKGWSVRETERHARQAVTEARPAGAKAAEAKNANVRDVEEQLTRKLGTRVTLADRKGKGHLKIEFASYDDLDRVIQALLS